MYVSVCVAQFWDTRISFFFFSFVVMAHVVFVHVYTPPDNKIRKDDDDDDSIPALNKNARESQSNK